MWFAIGDLPETVATIKKHLTNNYDLFATVVTQFVYICVIFFIFREKGVA